MNFYRAVLASTVMKKRELLPVKVRANRARLQTYLIAAKVNTSGLNEIVGAQEKSLIS